MPGAQPVLWRCQKVCWRADTSYIRVVTHLGHCCKAVELPIPFSLPTPPRSRSARANTAASQPRLSYPYVRYRRPMTEFEDAVAVAHRRSRQRTLALETPSWTGQDLPDLEVKMTHLETSRRNSGLWSCTTMRALGHVRPVTQILVLI